MKQTMDFYDFKNAFRNYNRDNQFSDSGLRALFEYLEQVEQELGYDMELDVISLCCEYSESSVEDALKEYELDSIGELRDNTSVIEVDNETIIFQVY